MCLDAETRTAKSVSFDRRIDNMLSLVERPQDMGHSSHRITRTFNDDLDRRMVDQRFPIVPHMSRAVLFSHIKGFGGIPFQVPVDQGEV